jgi:hypothetical protein
MARYLFHLHECGTVLDDEEGSELTDIEAARAHAVQAARDVMCAEVKAGRLCFGCCIVIEDERGTEVGRVPFRDVLTVTGIQSGAFHHRRLLQRH